MNKIAINKFDVRLSYLTENDMKRVTLDETDEVECRIKSAFLI